MGFLLYARKTHSVINYQISLTKNWIIYPNISTLFTIPNTIISHNFLLSYCFKFQKTKLFFPKIRFYIFNSVIFRFISTHSLLAINIYLPIINNIGTYPLDTVGVYFKYPSLINLWIVRTNNTKPLYKKQHWLQKTSYSITSIPILYTSHATCALQKTNIIK